MIPIEKITFKSFHFKIIDEVLIFFLVWIYKRVEVFLEAHFGIDCGSLGQNIKSKNNLSRKIEKNISFVVNSVSFLLRIKKMFSMYFLSDMNFGKT